MRRCVWARRPAGCLALGVRVAAGRQGRGRGLSGWPCGAVVRGAGVCGAGRVGRSSWSRRVRACWLTVGWCQRDGRGATGRCATRSSCCCPACRGLEVCGVCGCGRTPTHPPWVRSSHEGVVVGCRDARGASCVCPPIAAPRCRRLVGSQIPPPRVWVLHGGVCTPHGMLWLVRPARSSARRGQGGGA